MENREDNSLKTFNTAKKFAEEVLFPLMFDFKRFQRQANFGSHILDDALQVSEEIREIQRFNGLKAMAETCHDLLFSIYSTVKLKGNKDEIKKLEELIVLINQVKIIFYDYKERFFKQMYKETQLIEVIDRIYFDKIRNIIDAIYVNIEILMTRNKLLFADSNDEFKSDAELMDQIKREYQEY